MTINKLVDRPVFKEGAEVIATLGVTEFRGFIRGVGIQGMIDLWIIEVHPFDTQKLPKQYPYTNILVPHPLVRPVETSGK